MTLEEKLKDIRTSIPKTVKLVAVSKYHPIEMIQQAYNTGERIFGENRAQELIAKVDQLPHDIQWHFIGNLQTNKVKQIAPYTTLIQSISNERLINAVQKEGLKLDKKISILLEVHVAQEETKQGFSVDELLSLITPEFLKSHPNIEICGLMGMASHVKDETIIRNDFKAIKHCFETLKATTFKTEETFKEISMGMTQDYKIALQEGATIVRIGTAIFGPRNY